MNVLKLTSPLTIYMCRMPDCYDGEDSYEDGYPTISAGEAAAYKLEVLGQIKCMELPLPFEQTRGLMAYYYPNDSVNEKVVSARPTVEVIKGLLTGVCYCTVNGELSDDELRELIDFISVQYSDGWGETLEQQEIPTNSGGAILVSFWSSNDDWAITTQKVKYGM